MRSAPTIRLVDFRWKTEQGRGGGLVFFMVTKDVFFPHGPFAFTLQPSAVAVRAELKELKQTVHTEIAAPVSPWPGHPLPDIITPHSSFSNYNYAFSKQERQIVFLLSFPLTDTETLSHTHAHK